MSNLYHPLFSLQQGNWFKLICGASFQHIPAIRSLALVYALAGADCIDVSADPAVITTVRSVLQVAQSYQEIARRKGFPASPQPWLMVSLNDGEDPHFRKAIFNPAICPDTCLRPCERICPAQAIAFTAETAGVMADRCYGCGRCLPVCPLQQITTHPFRPTWDHLANLVVQGIDALEIHTQVGHLQQFGDLWATIAPWVPHLKLVAISCPDGEQMIDYLWAIYDLMQPKPAALIWQTDGRPMSGDIGDGATRSAVRLGQKVLAAGLPGFVQLAGGTNAHTVEKLKTLRLLASSPLASPEVAAEWPVNPVIAGIAYGSYARVLLSPVLDQLEQSAVNDLESHPDLLWQGVALAYSLTQQLKSQPPEARPFEVQPLEARPFERIVMPTFDWNYLPRSPALS